MPAIAWCLLLICVFEFFLMYSIRHVVSPFLAVKFPFGKTGSVSLERKKNFTYNFIPIYKKGDASYEAGKYVQDYDSKTELGQIDKDTYSKRYKMQVTSTGLSHHSGVKLYIKNESEITTENNESKPSALDQDSLKNIVNTEVEAQKAWDAFLKPKTGKLNNVKFIAIFLGVFIFLIFVYLMLSLAGVV